MKLSRKLTRAVLLFLFCLLAGPGANAATFLQDNFSGTANTLLVGHAPVAFATDGTHTVWYASPYYAGDWSLDGAGGVYPSGAGPDFVMSPASTGTTATLYTQWGITPLTLAGNAGFFLRANATTQTFYQVVQGFSASSINLNITRWVGNTSTNIVSSFAIPGGAVSSSDVFLLKTADSGASTIFTLYRNGTQSGTWTDSAGIVASSTTDRFGLQVGGSQGGSTSTTTGHLTSLLVTDTAPTVGTISVSPGSIVPGSQSTALTVTEAGAATYTAGSPGSPTFTITPAGVTFTQVVNSTTQATLTVTAATAGSYTVSDGTRTTGLTVAVAAVSQAVWEGDSLTYSQGTTTGAGTTTGTSYPSVCLSYLGSSWAGANMGISGETLTTMIANDGGGGQATTRFNGAYANHIVFIQGGHNDYYNGGTGGVTATTVESRMQTLCQAWKSAGWKVVVETEMPSSYNGYPANFDTLRNTSNAWIRANWRTFADALDDLAADSRMGPDGAETNTTYFQSDRAHPTDAGYAIMAQYAAPAAATALNPGGIVASTTIKRRIQ